MKKSAIIIAALIAGIAAEAQNFHKEITIERQFNPTLRAATRLSSKPLLQQPELKVEPLRFSDVVIATETGTAIDTLSAASPMAAITPSPYRGYAALGYFPVYNLGVSAGYRIIDKSSTSLGVWTQFNGSSYKADYNSIEDRLDFNRNTITAGADFTSIFNRAGRLDLSADFTYDNLREPWSTDFDKKSYGISMFNIDARWSARSNAMAYYIAADYHNFGAHQSPNILASQHNYNLQGGIACFLSEKVQFTGLVGLDFLTTNDFILSSKATNLYAVDGETSGIINLDPAVRYNDNNWRVKIGLKLQLLTSMSKTINIAPDIALAYTHSSAFSAFATINGSRQFNRLDQLWQWSPYINPQVAYGASNIPLDVNIGFTVGPFKGFSATISAGYAMANDWLMPDYNTIGASNTPGGDINNGGAGNGGIDSGIDERSVVAKSLVNPVVLSPIDLRAFHARLTLGYTHSSLFEAEASLAFSPGSETKAYYLNRDRAKFVINFNAKSKVTERIALNASFTLRCNRTAYPSAIEYSLGNLNSLDLGADYTLNKAVNLFARLENILNNRAELTLGIPSQGIHGAIGAAIKF